MNDIVKNASKFDLQKIIEDVKAMVSPVAIPEANKNDPIAYHLSELNKIAKELAEIHAKQADFIAKMSDNLGALYQATASSQKGQVASAETAAVPAPEVTADTTTADKT